MCSVWVWSAKWRNVCLFFLSFCQQAFFWKKENQRLQQNIVIEAVCQATSVQKHMQFSWASAKVEYRGALGSGCPCCWQTRLLHASASLSCPPERAGWVSPTACTLHPDRLRTETRNHSQKYWRWRAAREESKQCKRRTIHHLHVLNDDREAAVGAVSGQQVLTAAREGEELVVKGLEVRLAHHQALAYTQTTGTLETQTFNSPPLTAAVPLSHQGSLHWCTPRNRGGTHCRKQAIEWGNITFLCLCVSLSSRRSLTRCCSPERWWILGGNVGPCAHKNTETPLRSGYHPTLYPLGMENKSFLKGSNINREREREGEGGGEVTRTCAAIRTLLLADLLDVKTVAGRGAGLGAFAVLHPNGTLRDWNTHTHNQIIDVKSSNRLLMDGQTHSSGSPRPSRAEASHGRGTSERTPAGWDSSSLPRPRSSDTPAPDTAAGRPQERPGGHSAGTHWTSATCCSRTRSTPTHTQD